MLMLSLTLDFQSHEMALAANLTEAEVAALRLYTGSMSSSSSSSSSSSLLLGPMYVPLNGALRMYSNNPSLLYNWQTTISVLYSAVLKVSSLSRPGKVYR